MLQKKSLSAFSLAMMIIIAVDSIRALPISAEYGFALISFYILSAVLFMLPVALSAAELATAWPENGGITVWAREAFGGRISFLVAWLQWLYNVVWYPTILIFLVETCLQVFYPNWVAHTTTTYFMICGLFILATLSNAFGMRISALTSDVGAIVGNLLPMLVLIIIAIIWCMRGHSIAIQFNWQNLIPNLHSTSNLAILSGMLFGLVGIEMPAAHAGAVKNPRRDYPRALFASSLIILITAILGSLAIAIIIPTAKINLGTALASSLQQLLAAAGLGSFAPFLIVCVAIGGLCGVSAWIIGPSKCLLRASQDGNAPQVFSKCNKYDAPIYMLLLQVIVFMLLAAAFFLFPTFNASYWLLNTIAAQLALIYYICFFASFIRLRQSQPNKARPFRVPGGNIGAYLIAGIGLITCVLVFSFGWLTPDQFVKNSGRYQLLLAGGIIIGCLPPLLWRKSKKKLTDI